MQDSIVLDDLDLRVVNALQIDPRASWAQVGAVLDIDPVTASRRWARLEEAGIAWVTAYVTAPTKVGPLALVELDCGGRALDVAELVLDDPQCVSIDIMSGGRDLLLTVTSRTLGDLSDYLLHRISALDRVRAVRTHLVARMIAEGADWRLTKLDAGQIARLTPVASPPDRPQRITMTADEQLLAELLVDDGRASTAALAAASGFSARKVRDMLRALSVSGRLTLRTEMRSETSGWPIYAWFFLRVPAASMASISQRLGSLPEIRTVLEVAGPSNVIMAVWLKELADVNRLEAAIERLLREVSITDRAVVLRTAKRIGVVLDPTGRRVRTVPMLR